MRGLKLILNRVGEKGAVVASFTDAWIETAIKSWKRDNKKSHLLQMRGLKLPGMALTSQGNFMSHLLQMRGLKLL